MRKTSLPIAAAMMLALAGAALAQSLAELAKKEKERRAQISAQAKTITDANAAKYKGGAVTTGTPAAAPPTASAEKKPPAAQGTSPADPAEPASDEPVDFQGRPESYWRQTFADARARVAALDNEANVLTLKLADLQNKFYQEADGFRQQQIQREIQKSIYEQDVNKQELANARQQLQALEIEARKSGALPGWIRP